ncbi:MAG: MFS transporter [Ferroplasma sp.]
MGKINPKHSFLFYSIMLILIAISMRATNNMVVTTVPLYSKYILKFSYELTAAVAAIIYLGTVMATTFINTRIGPEFRRILFIISNLFLIIFLILYYFSGNLSVFLISFLIGMAYGIILPNIVTSAGLYPDERKRERLLAIYSVGLSFSLVFGPSLESYLLTITNYRAIFLFFAPVALIGFLVSFFIEFPEDSNRKARKPIIHKRPLYLSILTITTYNIPFAALTVFLAIFAETRFHVSSFLAYLPFVFFFSVSLVTRIVLSIRPVRNIRNVLAIAPAITIAVLMAFPFLPNYLSFVAMMMLLGIPHGSIFPIATIEISRGSLPSERNAMNSYFYSYNMVLFMVIPLIFSLIITYIGFEKTFALLIIPVAISLAIIILKFWNSNDILGERNSKNIKN